MRITIHQPNFVPYSGFFDKMAAADMLIIMHHCQWEKNNYQNRFNVGALWNTMSTNRSLQPINEKIYLSPTQDWERIIKRYPKLKVFNPCITPKLYITNAAIIKVAAQQLGIKTHMGSDFPTALTRTERLVEICKAYKATTYVSGPSGNKYLDVKLFEQAGIQVEFIEIKNPRPLIHLL